MRSLPIWARCRKSTRRKSPCPAFAAVFGELDNLVPRENVLHMFSLLTEHQKSFDIRIYPEAPHGFLNDTMPGRFRLAQTEAAWQQITSFLDSVFKGEWNPERARWRFHTDSSVGYDFSKMKRWA
jgi:carboxymethylenebutenolidase